MTKRHYHLIGIGGTAMGSIAGLLRAAGHEVTGSDENVYPPMSDQLRALGIPYAEGYSAVNVGVGSAATPRPDIVVVGNAISRGNPELEAVLDEKMYYTSGASVVKEEFLRRRHSIAVAGTHGKTSTTSLLAWLLESAGLNPSFLIGGVAENFGSSFRLTDSPFFVIEADEYDTAYFDKGPKMWHYLPQTAIVNNIEFDHADIYRDEIAYRFAFERFINLIPRSGTLIAGWDSELVREIAPATFSRLESFGYGEEGAGGRPLWRAEEVGFEEQVTRFTVLQGEEVWGRVETPLAGAFSVRNCLAAIAAAEAVGADRDGVREGLRSYQSVRRRMEIRGEARGVTVIDDFAHHPTAIRETVDAVRQRFLGRPIIAVYEPRSYTAQRREFQEPYRTAFAGADEVVLAGLFRPERYTEQTALDPVQLTRALTDSGTVAHYIPEVAEIIAHLEARLQGGEVVLIMSNGGFGGIHERLLERLRDSRDS